MRIRCGFTVVSQIDTDNLFDFHRKVAKNKSKASKQSESPLEEASSTPIPLEVKTQLPLRIQDSERTEYVAPVNIQLVCECIPYSRKIW